MIPYNPNIASNDFHIRASNDFTSLQPMISKSL